MASQQDRGLALDDSLPSTASVTAHCGTASVDTELLGFPVHRIRAPLCMSVAATLAHSTH